MFYSQLSQVFVYSGTLSIRPPSGTLLLRRLQLFNISINVLNISIIAFFYLLNMRNELGEIVDELNFVPGGKRLEAVALRMHETHQDLVGRRPTDDAQMGAMDIDWVIIGSGHLAIIDLNLPAAS